MVSIRRVAIDGQNRLESVDVCRSLYVGDYLAALCSKVSSRWPNLNPHDDFEVVK